jgi:hypothetical protein
MQKIIDNKNLIKTAVDSAQRSQRNYDLSKSITQEDLDTLIYPKLLVGVGFPNIQLERTQHLKVLNKDVLEKFRTGALEEHWNFPTFKKHTKVTINGN